MSIHSAAQLAMFEKAAADPDYAKLRGISQDLAKARVAAYRDAGSPELRDRAERAASKTRQRKQPPGLGLLGS